LANIHQLLTPNFLISSNTPSIHPSEFGPHNTSPAFWSGLHYSSWHIIATHLLDVSCPSQPSTVNCTYNIRWPIILGYILVAIPLFLVLGQKFSSILSFQRCYVWLR
jgi:hypothetical protein